MMHILLEAGRLAVWGVAVVLCWTCSLRLVNLFQVKLHSLGHLKTLPRAMLPMTPWGQWWITWAGLAAGNAVLIAFGDGATTTLHIRWLFPHDTTGIFQLLRTCLTMTVLMFFLTRIAENPRYKVLLMGGWSLFSFVLVAVAAAVR